MNLVERYQRLSDIRELSETFSFSVIPCSESYLWQSARSLESSYLIAYRSNISPMDKQYLGNKSVSYVMNKALQYKKDYDRLVFKTSYRSYDTFLSDRVFIFESKEDAEKALMNFLTYTRQKHGVYAKKIMNEALKLSDAF